MLIIFHKKLGMSEICDFTASENWTPCLDISLCIIPNTRVETFCINLERKQPLIVVRLCVVYIYLRNYTLSGLVRNDKNAAWWFMDGVWQIWSAMNHGEVQLCCGLKFRSKCFQTTHGRIFPYRFRLVLNEFSSVVAWFAIHFVTRNLIKILFSINKGFTRELSCVSSDASKNIQDLLCASIARLKN